MARATITRQVAAKTGLNITDMTYATMATGSGNGAQCTYLDGMFLLLKNATGGNATFTIKVPTPAAYSDKSSTIGDISVVLATAKTLLYPLVSLLKQSDGNVYVDCDVAAGIAAVSLP